MLFYFKNGRKYFKRCRCWVKRKIFKIKKDISKIFYLYLFVYNNFNEFIEQSPLINKYKSLIELVGFNLLLPIIFIVFSSLISFEELPMKIEHKPLSNIKSLKIKCKCSMLNIQCIFLSIL